MSLSELNIKILTGQPVTDLDKASAFQLTVKQAPENALELEQAIRVLEYMVIHCVDHPHKSEINNQYVQLLIKQNQEDQFAKIIVALVIDKILTYALKQLETLSIKVTEEDLFNCREKCYEEMVFKLEGHLAEAKTSLMKNQLPKYALAFGLYLSEKSLGYTARQCEMTPVDVKTWSITRDWTKLRKGLENGVSQVVRAVFDIDRRLESIKVAHYSGPLAQLLGGEAIARLKEDVKEMPTEKVIKLFNEVATLHAKLTGQQLVADTTVNVGIANIYKKLDEIDVKQLPDVRPERKYIE